MGSSAGPLILTRRSGRWFQRPPHRCFGVWPGVRAALRWSTCWGPLHSPQWRHRDAARPALQPTQPDMVQDPGDQNSPHPACSPITNLLHKHLTLCVESIQFPQDPSIPKVPPTTGIQVNLWGLVAHSAGLSHQPLLPTHPRSPGDNPVPPASCTHQWP
jgi:hypothetical protein